MTLSKCDKEEMGTEIKIAAQKRHNTAVALCAGWRGGSGLLFLGGFGRREACYLLLGEMNCFAEKC